MLRGEEPKPKEYSVSSEAEIKFSENEFNQNFAQIEQTDNEMLKQKDW